MKFRNTFSSCMMRRIRKCHRGGFSGFDANQVFLRGAKTALTIFLKFCIPPYFGLNFLMKKFFDPPKRFMTSFWGSENPENHLFQPKSDIFHPISTKLSKSIKNVKTHILVYFDPNRTPLWRHNGGPKTPKISFFDLNRTIFTRFQQNFPKVLRI